MKVTKEELLKLFKLKVGDEIVIQSFLKIGEPCKARIHEKKSSDGIDTIYLNLIDYGAQFSLGLLAMYEYEIRQAKKIGDTMCKDYSCFDCPLQYLEGCDICKEETLYAKLNRVFEADTDHPIYKAYKAILDKEE